MKSFGTSSSFVPSVSFHLFKNPKIDITETISVISSSEKCFFNSIKCCFEDLLGVAPAANAKSKTAFSLSE